MKKLLLSSAALCGLAMVASPASAQISLDLGGHFKGYAAYVDQDERTGFQTNDLDFIRNTELHFTGETTLDSGLTVGFHTEAEVDGNEAFNVDESYIYMSGSWGRLNAGDEDGAAYLLQVAAPSADSNIDGIRQFVNPVNYNALTALGSLVNRANIGADNSGGIDYDMDPTGKNTKLTYLSPILSGFQVGASYTPDSDASANENGIGLDNVEDTIGATYEAAVRYEGNFNNVGVIVGAGYAMGENERDANAALNTDDREVFNVGLDLDMGAFGLGAIYREDNGGREGTGADDEETIVVGADYTTGPFKLGASYYTQDNTFAVQNLDTERYSGGVTYTYGPGMTFRGSVGYVEHDGAALTTDVDATYVTLGTQINF